MSPLFVLVNFYVFVCLIRIDLGRWPVFNDPYLSGLPSHLQGLSIWLSFLSFPLVAALCVALSLWGRWRYVDFPIWKLLALILASTALLLATAEIDPGGFRNWFVD